MTRRGSPDPGTTRRAPAASAVADAPSPRFFDDAAAFGAWLAANAGSARALLVGFHAVRSGRPSMSWPESVDEALCVGWIDGVRRRIDASAYAIRFSPRTPGSIWSAVNIAKVEALRAQGRMTAAGEAAFAARREARSRVYAYEQAEAATLAPDELARFRADPLAWAFFEATPPGYRKVVLHWVTTAKREATRASRLAQLVAACADGRRLR